MITDRRFRRRHLLSASAGVTFCLSILGRPAEAFAGSWSPEVTIFPQQQSTATNAFALNPAGDEDWVTASLGNFTMTVQSAKRAFGGPWSSQTTIASVRGTSLPLTTALSANNDAAAAWIDAIALRSPAGVWQAPVDLRLMGSVSSFQVKLDAQGNGVAVWGRLTDTNSLVEAVTWTANGTFGNVVQLSPSSHGAFGPQLAVDDAGTAVVVWLASPPRDNADPYQVESATRPAGGNWSAVTTASPVVPQTWAPGVALDGSGNATAMWTTATTLDTERLFAATRPAGGGWGSPTRIEPTDWHALSENSLAADAAGNVTVSWVGQDQSGLNNVRTATLPVGGAWEAPTTLGQCRIVSSYCLVQVSAARDGSITVVGWGAYQPARGNNIAVRLGSGAWVPMAVGNNGPQIGYVLTTNNARASVVWKAPIGVRYRVDLRQSDFQ
jgi:hypothetical protein